MKPLKVKQFTQELQKLGANVPYVALVVNLISQYNDLVKQYDPEVSKQKDYMLYQLNVQISKLVLDMVKIKNKAAKLEPEEEDAFSKLMNALKKEDISNPKR